MGNKKSQKKHEPKEKTLRMEKKKKKKKSTGTLKSRAAKMRRWSVVLEQCQD